MLEAINEKNNVKLIVEDAGGELGYYVYVFDLYSQVSKADHLCDNLQQVYRIAKQRIRKEGGGRHAIDKQFKNIDDVFLLVIAEHIAGDPMDEKIKWIKLTRYQISAEMKKLGVSISRNIVRKL